MLINSQSRYFFLNGNKYVLHKRLTILDIVKYFNYNISLFILEHNQIVRNKESWNKILINNNDRIEIITIVGGG